MSNKTNQFGPTGSSGGNGLTVEYKQKTFLCKKNYGFFEAGQVIMLKFFKNEDMCILSSKDDKMKLYIDIKEAKEYFIFGEDLRDKTIDDIIK